MTAIQLRTPGLFITATDTGVGKTVATCAIAAALRRQGADVRVGVCKPFASGCRRDREGLVSPDGEALAHFANSVHPLDVVTPDTLCRPARPRSRRRGEPAADRRRRSPAGARSHRRRERRGADRGRGRRPRAPRSGQAEGRRHRPHRVARTAGGHRLPAEPRHAQPHRPDRGRAQAAEGRASRGSDHQRLRRRRRRSGRSVGREQSPLAVEDDRPAGARGTPSGPRGDGKGRRRRARRGGNRSVTRRGCS